MNNVTAIHLLRQGRRSGKKIRELEKKGKKKEKKNLASLGEEHRKIKNKIQIQT